MRPKRWTSSDGTALSYKTGPLDRIRRIPAGLDLSTFDCGEEDFNDFIRNEAMQDFLDGYSVTYIGYIGKEPAAYVTLVAAAYRAEDYFSADSRYRYRQIPAIRIARIATDRHFHRTGCGRALVKYSHAVALRIRNVIGCRLLVTDALPGKMGWYEKMGFALSRRVVPGEKRSSYPMHTIIPPPESKYQLSTKRR